MIKSEIVLLIVVTWIISRENDKRERHNVYNGRLINSSFCQNRIKKYEFSF